MDRPRNISSGEAMRWNADVERRRREYHERRCAEDPIYRRAYERQQEERRRLQKLIGKSMVQIADAMNAECQQRVNSVAEGVDQQPVRTHEEVMNDRMLMDSVIKYSAEWMAHSAGLGLGFAVAAMMLADGEKLKQRMKELDEEKPYAEEIRRADEQFDREMIRMSGFEW
jgi:hypothetical protein